MDGGMKKNSTELNIPEFIDKFSGQKIVSKADLRQYYHLLNPDLSDQAFRRILYGLEKHNYIASSGSGIYILQDPFSSQKPRKNKFVPAVTSIIKKINDEIMEAFPYLDYLLWETKILQEFMGQQPGQNLIILETEKGTEESVFNHISAIYPGQTYLDPDRITIERYVFQQPEPILVSRLVTQTPKGKRVNGVPYAKIEKILVDILVDEKKYFLFQGQELVSIFENAFDRYVIDEKSLLRYAGRRNAISKLEQFIRNQTQIDSLKFREDTI
jgi:hypothetical protein